MTPFFSVENVTQCYPAEKAKLMVSVMGLPQEAESVLAESPTKI